MNDVREIMRWRLEDGLCHELGEPALDALAQPGTSDVLLLEDGTLWVNAAGRWTVDSAAVYSIEQRETIIGLAANSLKQEATFANPIIEGEVTIKGKRYRFTGHLPPIVAAPEIAFRKPAEIVYTLADYERDGIITAQQRELLRQAVIKRKNIIIAGAMGSGKSTLANALIAEIPPETRVGTIEDTYELQVRLPNRSQLHTTSTIDLRRLVRTALRLQLDRIIVGEVRGAEALDLLKAWNTGCSGGIATIHANSAAAALLRLSSLIQEAGVPEQPQLIAEAVDLIVFIELENGEHRRAQRRVTEIVRMEGLNVSGEFELAAA
ncbi:MAG: Flp pilus assembly complex ATPase component TadA [Deltaproteobacteria bacterium]|nr:Flp pilus assembly complex ATPase component TadA [Deltaproteobacteria bacterium]